MTEAAMTETSQTGLKVIVERAVRPVQAALDRKRKMREELLAHVTGVFDEELAHHDDEAAALVETERRFGDPSEVAAQLEAAVPAYDRPFYRLERMTRVRPGESLYRRAGRWALLIAALNASMSALGAIQVVLFAEERYRLPSMLALLVVMTVGSAVLTVAFVLLTHSLRQALFGSAGVAFGRAAAAAALSCLAPVAMVFLLYLAVSGDATTSLNLMPRSAAFVPLIPGIMLLAAWQIEQERRYVREWAELRID